MPMLAATPPHSLSPASPALPLLFCARTQKVMVEYFAGRPGRLAQEGLAGLHRSSAGLFYLPFLAGVSLHFRFAGQSIPNRCAPSCAAGCGLPVSLLAAYRRGVRAVCELYASSLHRASHLQDRGAQGLGRESVL